MSIERKDMSRFKIGQGIAMLGKKLNLPDWGISEAIGGYSSGYDYRPGGIAGIPMAQAQGITYGLKPGDYIRLDGSIGNSYDDAAAADQQTQTPAPTQTGGGVAAPVAAPVAPPVAPVFPPTPYDDGTGTKLYYTPEDLAEAVNRRINKDYNESVQMIEKNFKNGFISIDERDAEIKKTRKALIQKKEEDLQSVSGYFNQIAPDAVQSGRGKLEAKAVEDYTTRNKSLGSELGANLYGADGRIRQDLNTTDLQPYMTELSDTGNLARAISGQYQNRDTNLQAANAAFNTGQTQRAESYIAAKGPENISDYSAYLNNAIIGSRKPAMAGVGQFSSVKKTDKYGNPIDEWTNQ
jgi:hypothetical protein